MKIKILFLFFIISIIISCGKIFKRETFVSGIVADYYNSTPVNNALVELYAEDYTGGGGFMSIGSSYTAIIIDSVRTTNEGKFSFSLKSKNEHDYYKVRAITEVCNYSSSCDAVELKYGKNNKNISLAAKQSGYFKIRVINSNPINNSDEITFINPNKSYGLVRIENQNSYLFLKGTDVDTTFTVKGIANTDICNYLEYSIYKNYQNTHGNRTNSVFIASGTISTVEVKY